MTCHEYATVSPSAHLCPRVTVTGTRERAVSTCDIRGTKLNVCSYRNEKSLSHWLLWLGVGTPGRGHPPWGPTAVLRHEPSEGMRTGSTSLFGALVSNPSSFRLVSGHPHRSSPHKEWGPPTKVLQPRGDVTSMKFQRREQLRTVRRQREHGERPTRSAFVWAASRAP